MLLVQRVVFLKARGLSPDGDGQLPGQLKGQRSGLHLILSLRLDSGLLNTGGRKTDSLAAAMSTLGIIKTDKDIECPILPALMLPGMHVVWSSIGVCCY